MQVEEAGTRSDLPPERQLSKFGVLGDYMTSLTQSFLHLLTLGHHRWVGGATSKISLTCNFLMSDTALYWNTSLDSVQEYSAGVGL